MKWPQLAELIAKELKGSPEDFLRAHWISKTMHPSSRPLSHAYMDDLSHKLYFRRELYPAACDPEFGTPYRFDKDDKISPQSIQHSFYLNMLYEQFGLRMDQVGDIVEIGGGYGNLARIIRNLGHRGRYQIADLPDIHTVQQHYLDNVLPNHGVEFISADDIAGGELLIATFSVSEMPMDLRQSLEKKYPAFRYLMFAATETFDEYDNVAYFSGLADRIGGRFFKDPHRTARWVLCAH